MSTSMNQNATVAVPPSTRISCLLACWPAGLLACFYLAFGLSFAVRSATSQSGCAFGTDALSANGICCNPDGVEAQVPAFPALTIDGRALEFTECRRNLRDQVSISIGAPQMENCDHFRIPIVITAGDWWLTGNFRAKYCRTWMDFDATGACRQRWRFLLNTDVTFSYDITNPPVILESFVPWCIVAGPGYRPHYSGHLDYQCAGSG